MVVAFGRQAAIAAPAIGRSLGRLGDVGFEELAKDLAEASVTDCSRSRPSRPRPLPRPLSTAPATTVLPAAPRPGMRGTLRLTAWAAAGLEGRHLQAGSTTRIELGRDCTVDLMEVTIRSNLGNLGRDNAVFQRKRAIELLRTTARQELRREQAKRGRDVIYFRTVDRSSTKPIETAERTVVLYFPGANGSERHGADCEAGGTRLPGRQADKADRRAMPQLAC